MQKQEATGSNIPKGMEMRNEAMGNGEWANLQWAISKKLKNNNQLNLKTFNNYVPLLWREVGVWLITEL